MVEWLVGQAPRRSHETTSPTCGPASRRQTKLLRGHVARRQLKTTKSEERTPQKLFLALTEAGAPGLSRAAGLSASYHCAVPVAPGAGAATTSVSRSLPEATVKRLPLYLQALVDANDDRMVHHLVGGTGGRPVSMAPRYARTFPYMGS